MWPNLQLHLLKKPLMENFIFYAVSVEDNFKDTLKKARIKNLNRVIISQSNINSIRNNIWFLSEAVLSLWFQNQNWHIISDKSICHSGFWCTFQVRENKYWRKNMCLCYIWHSFQIIEYFICFFWYWMLSNWRKCT